MTYDEEDEILPEELDEEEVYNQAQVAERDSYEAQAMVHPERQVELPDDGEGRERTLTEGIEDMSDLTDQQAFMRQLFPSIGTRVQQAQMVGRVSPDVFLPLLRIQVTNDIMMSDPSEPVDVNAIIAKNYTLLSIGLDGKGRIDIAELSGAAREEKHLEAGMGGTI